MDPNTRGLIMGAAATADIVDPYFKNVSLLIHANGTNGGQNSTFNDSSPNNFVGTGSGDVAQGTLSPYGDKWSTYYPGIDNNHLTISHSSIFPKSTENCTFEGWINVFETGVTKGILCKVSPSAQQWSIVLNTNNTISLSTQSGSSNLGGIGSATSLVPGTWYHFAFTLGGGTGKIWINGVLENTASVSLYTQTNPVYIGAFDPGNPPTYIWPFRGYLSNIRISNIQRYTSNFNPPVAPFISDANTVLLCCQDNRIYDASPNNFTITEVGSVRVSKFSPISTLTYTPSLYAGSARFDGLDDSIDFAHNTNLSPGLNPFTIEAWIYRFTSSAAHTIYAKADPATSIGLELKITSTNVLRFVFGASSMQSTLTIPAAKWTHVAVVREGTGTSQTKLYINGVNSGIGTVASNFTDANPVRIGTNRSGGEDFNGHIAGVRFVNGTAVYTTNFTPPKTPPTSITNTQLLLNFSNANIIDNSMINSIQTSGAAQTSSTQAKQGFTSFFPSSGWLVIKNNTNVSTQIFPENYFHIAPFTIEMWVYRTSVANTQGLIAKGSSTTGWQISFNTSNQVVFTYGSSTITSSITIGLGVWAHIAIVREGTGMNQAKIYIDGVNSGIGTVSNNFSESYPIYIGTDRSASTAFSGYIDEIRITNGIARYTAAFAPPSGQFPDR